MQNPASYAATKLLFGWLILLTVAGSIYSTGFSGSFIFDDLANLRDLSSIQGAPLLESGPYVLQGFAGPSGRPLSLLSFAMQRQSWPDDPAAFKFVNFFIHGFNATLLLVLGLTLRRFQPGPSAMWPLWVPVAAAGLWLLWPIQVSTTLYVVQRMTLLAASCMSLGLVLYVRARMAHDAGRSVTAYLWFATAFFTGLPLGILFKESAGVFPLLVLALDATLLRRATRERPAVWTLALWGWIAGLAFYLLILTDPIAGFAVREFSLYERLLSQARILWMYAGQIFLPSVSSLHFIYDDYEISRGLLRPASTLVALAALVALASWSLYARKRYSVAAFAVLFFLANHALESTFVPLELVFEHRNYLASFGLALGLACAVDAFLSLDLRNRLRQLIKISAAAYCFFVVFVTYNLTSLWGNDLSMAAWIMEQQPDSRRARMQYAYELLKQGHPQEAIAILDRAVADFPDDLSFPLALVDVACYYPDYGRPDALQLASTALASGTVGDLPAFAFLDRLVARLGQAQCPAHSVEELLSLLEAAKLNPSMARHRASLHILSGNLFSRLGRTVDARRELQMGLKQGVRPDLLVQAAMWEISNRNWEDARRYVAMLGPDGSLGLRAQLAIASDRQKLEALLAAETTASD